MKLFFIAFLMIFAGSAHADKLDKDGILRNDDGSVHRMTWRDAMKACPAGTHLPTIRELAKMSESQGSKILETTEVQDGAVPAGYNLVEAINSDGKEDTFYFNYDSYKRPHGDLGSEWFRSSSIHPYYSYYCHAINGNDGVLYFLFVRDSHKVAVRCVAR